MEIVRAVKNLSKMEKYQMINSPEIGKIRDIISVEIVVTAHIIFIDNDKTVLCLLTDTNECFATNSDSFIRSYQDILSLKFEDIDNINEKYELGIRVIEGRSKQDRSYMNCVCTNFYD